jgi:hypothetical protein
MGLKVEEGMQKLIVAEEQQGWLTSGHSSMVQLHRSEIHSHD